jgi:glutamyl/glutaminyl-tRNA synthetase
MLARLVASKRIYPCFDAEIHEEEGGVDEEKGGMETGVESKWRDADPEVVRGMLEKGTPHAWRSRADFLIFIKKIAGSRAAWCCCSGSGRLNAEILFYFIFNRFRVPRRKVVSIRDLVRGKVEWECVHVVSDFVCIRANGDPYQPIYYFFLN